MGVLTMSAPDAVLELVDRFDRNIDAYRSGAYNETQVRREFIDPLFIALGWDVNNERGYAEAYKDVIHEDSIKIGGATKAPDYCFRTGGARKFFLEAKKPSVNIKHDVHPAYQLRRYAWSAKLPLSVLTDFEELAVYDCRVRPHLNDKASIARVMYFTFSEYADRWNDIAGVFDRESVFKGSFDKYVESSKRKKGTTEVDAAFLKEIEGWRDVMARNIALRNPGLSKRELNFAVQRTIDRIIFLRICEDRGVEQYGKLMALQNGAEVYKRLLAMFHQADQRYNSGLFHFRTEKNRPGHDALTPQLSIDDKVLKDICKALYYPESPYEFSVLPSDILGQVYEQFLGKVIRLTKGRRAVIEEKPEVRKAGGVYYTPTYIVDYIVKNTVGKLLEGKTPKRAAGLRVLDPACGSGSFLIGAYQYLLDWHRDWYLEKGGAKHKDKIYQGPGGTWLLSTGEKKRILLNNIFGVDIDPQAVEVTKLSLLLKVLENENKDTLERQLKLFAERALPDLGDNIKCGNSLIGPDFYEGTQLSMLDEEEMYRINVFDWQAEFPEIMKSGGFDAVIGNPPYIRIQNMKEWAPVEVEFYKKRYVSAGKGNYDIYVVFAEKGLSLLNVSGRLGYILPHKFMNAKYGEGLRGVLAKGRNLSHMIHFADQQVFDQATTYTCLLFLDRQPKEAVDIVKVKDLDAWRIQGEGETGSIPADTLNASEWNFVVGKGADLFRRLSEMPVKLGDVARIFQGLVTGADPVFILDSPRNLETDILRPFIKSQKLSSYSHAKPEFWMLFPYDLQGGKATLFPRSDFEEKYPNAWRYLNDNKNRLTARERGKWDHAQWYAFGRSQNLTMMEGPKLIIQVMSIGPRIIYDDENFYMTGRGSGPFYGIRQKDDRVDLLLLCGIMNSKLFGYIIQNQSTPMRGGYIKFSKQYIETAPIPILDQNQKKDKAIHDRMVELVERMLDLNKRLHAATLAQEKEMIQRQIDATDRQIDNLVYELYDLTDEEIKTVEEATR
jgi:predicted type IV restriction endonuclease